MNTKHKEGTEMFREKKRIFFAYINLCIIFMDAAISRKMLNKTTICRCTCMPVFIALLAPTLRFRQDFMTQSTSWISVTVSAAPKLWSLGRVQSYHISILIFVWSAFCLFVTHHGRVPLEHWLVSYLLLMFESSRFAWFNHLHYLIICMTTIWS